MRTHSPGRGLKSLSRPILCGLFLSILAAGCAVIHRGAVTTATVEWIRPDGSIWKREVIRDTERGGAAELLDRDTFTNLAVAHTNQSALGGSSRFGVGAATVDISSNAAAVITAGGTAIGTAVGAAAGTAVKTAVK